MIKKFNQFLNEGVDTSFDNSELLSSIFNKINKNDFQEVGDGYVLFTLSFNTPININGRELSFVDVELPYTSESQPEIRFGYPVENDDFDYITINDIEDEQDLINQINRI